MQKTKDPLPTLPGWLSVKQAAQLAGRSVGSIRRAIALGDLPVRRLQGRILISQVFWQQFVLMPQRPGERCRPLPCQTDLAEEPQARVLTTLTVQLRAGQQEVLEQRLRVFAQEQLHCFPGTLDHLIKLGESRPDTLLVLLVWDASSVPPEETREAMLAALRADLATILDWQTEKRYEQHILLHTL